MNPANVPITLAAAGVLGLGVVLTTASAAGQAPVKDTFRGSFSQGTGQLRHLDGSAVVTLAPGSGSGRRSVTVTIRDTGCSGRLRGTLTTQRPTIPDTGTKYLLTAAGRLGCAARASARGTIQGTGFTARGRETMQITLRAGSASARLEAQSGEVRGFTGP